ncbi:MAG: hypothetical protein WC399_04890 [Bacilli bacterium]|jgi:drug/metabolite transporter (DMT)-like permease
MFFTSSQPIAWLPMIVFALIVAVVTIVIGKFLFKRKPAWIFALPAALTLFGGVLFGMGFLIETWDALSFFLFGILLLLAGGGSLLGALIAFFLIFKAHKKQGNPDDVFSR